MLKQLTFLLATLCCVATPVKANGLTPLIKQCDSCHGVNGISTSPQTPIIGGLSKVFFEERMYAFIDGERQGSPMANAVKGLTDAQVTALAAHYDALPFVPAKQPFDATVVDKGRALHQKHCAMCHSNSGSVKADAAGYLAGQWRPYLAGTIEAYKSHERATLAPMLNKLKMLDDNQIDALLQFYASESNAGQ